MQKFFVKKLSVLMVMASFVLWSVPVRALLPSAGIDFAGMDRSVDPGDDFFLYANGGWFAHTEIPADRTSLGVFQGIASEVAKRNADLLTEAAKTNTPEAKMVADYYAAYMDDGKIETLGTTPIKTELDQIAALKNKTQL